MRTCMMLVAALALGGCTKTPVYLYGRDFTKLEYVYTGPTTGVYPSLTILDDPNNPFAYDLPSEEVKGDDPKPDTKWILQASAGPIASYYAWGTVLARNPYGEAQFFTAKNLEQIFRTGQVGKGEQSKVAEQGVNAFQAMLDYFPDAVTYDASGKIPSYLATPALQGLLGLGGTAKGGWVLVMGDDGQPKAVRQ